MLNYRLLDYKDKITKDGNTYVDLLSKVWQNKEPNNGRIIMVNEYYVARPDLISLAVYGSDEYADVLCKINGISNPFELNEGTILFLPQLEYMVQSMSRLTTNVASVLASESDNIGVQHMTKQKSKTEDRSPNQQTKGETNYYIDTANGLVYY